MYTSADEAFRIRRTSLNKPTVYIVWIVHTRGGTHHWYATGRRTQLAQPGCVQWVSQNPGPALNFTLCDSFLDQSDDKINVTL